MTTMTRKPTHPGIVFYEDYMKPMGISNAEAASLLGVSRLELSKFIKGKASLTTDMAMRISKATGNTAESWMNMQKKLSL